MKKLLSIILSATILASLCVASAYAALDSDGGQSEAAQTTESALQAMRDSLTLTFHDEFDGTEIDKTKWGYEYDLNGGTRNGECQLYTSSDKTKNAWVEDGNLVIEGRRVTKDEVWYNADGTKQEPQQDADGNYYLLGNDGKSKYYFTSASLRNYWARYPDEADDDWGIDHWTRVYDNNSVKYGMIEARIMFPEQSTETDETWPAFWTTGGSAIGPEGELDSNDQTKNWPTAGEIDIAELFSKQYSMNQLVHYSPNYDGNHSTALPGGYNPSDGKASTIIRGSYHTYGIYYTDKFFMYYVDDVVCAVYDITSPKFDFFRNNPQFVFLNLAIGNMNGYGLGPNAAPDLVKSRMKVDYVRAYQALDGDYSHIKVLSAPTDTVCSATSGQTSWQPGTKALNISNSAKNFNIKTKEKIDEGNYDVYLTGSKAWWTTGAFDVSINGSAYTANADYTQRTESAETGEWYCDDLSTYIGTANITNGAHNMQVNLNRTIAPKDVVGCVLRALILVGKSSNDATVTIDDDSEVPTTTAAPTSAATTAQQTTTVSGDSEIVYNNFFMTYDPNTKDNYHIGNAESASFNKHAVKYDSSAKNNMFLVNRSQLATNPGGSSDLKIIWSTNPQYDLTSGTYRLVAFVQPSGTSGTFSFTQYEDGNVDSANGTLVGNIDFTNAAPIASYDDGKAKAYEVGEFTIVNGDTDKTAFKFAPVSDGKLTLYGLAAVPTVDEEPTTESTSATVPTTTDAPTKPEPTTVTPPTTAPTTAELTTVAPTTTAAPTTTINPTTTATPTTTTAPTTNPTTAAPTTTATPTTTVNPTTTVPTTVITPILYGDANSDGNVNLLDLIAMRKHLAKWSITVDLSAADCNADGNINLLDLILMRKYLAKWNVVLGPQK